MKELSDPPLWPSPVLADCPPDRRYLVGVSGGRDSVVLLHWLLRQGYRNLVVCHLNHLLRGRSSAADARFVEQLAKRNALPFVGDEIDVARRAAHAKQSLETAARSARHEFFARVARRRRCPTIFLAHHADDLVETFLMNLFRGAGGGGRSMRAVTEQRIGRTSLTVVRPMLGVWRKEIDAYVRAARLRFREDASNKNLDRTRNRMRHKIIPALEKDFGRSIRQTLWRAAMIAAEEDAWLESLLPSELRDCEELPVKRLRQEPVALQRRIIRRWLGEQQVAEIGFDLIESVRALLDVTSGPARVNLPGDRHARRRAGVLFLENPL